MKNLNILVTGANRGIGYQFVKGAFIRNPSSIILGTSKEPNKGILAMNKIKEELNSSVNLQYHQLDVTNPSSILDLVDYCQRNKMIFDVILHNAGVGEREEIIKKRKASEEEYETIMNTNFFSTTDFIEKSLNLISENGKCVIASSFVGLNRMQGKDGFKALERGFTTLDELKTLELEYKEKWKENDRNWNKSVYGFSKALLNAYNRYVLPIHPVVKERSISTVVYTPGWVASDMGGSSAPIKLEDGARVPLHIVFDLPFKDNSIFHGKFIDEHLKVVSY